MSFWQLAHSSLFHNDTFQILPVGYQGQIVCHITSKGRGLNLVLILGQNTLFNALTNATPILILSQHLVVTAIITCAASQNIVWDEWSKAAYTFIAQHFLWRNPTVPHLATLTQPFLGG